MRPSASDHPQRSALLPQELLAELVGAGYTPAVGVQAAVPVHGLGQVDPEAVHVELLHELHCARDEELADGLIPEARRPARRAVVEVTTVEPRVVGAPASYQ